MTTTQTPETVSPLRQISFELTNICNLRCSYCVRDDESLYRTPAHYFPVTLLRRVLAEASATHPLQVVSFTGGEPTLHPKFGEVVGAVAGAGLRLTLVTNGWHFERVRPHLLKHREAIGHVAFSVDGATAPEHDGWRGEGSFARVLRAVESCRADGLSFGFKVVLRRDVVARLEAVAMTAARLGARSLQFSHFLPTSSAAEGESALSAGERREAEREVGALARILRMQVGLSAGYHNTDPDPPCIVLRGESCHVDFRGRLTLCCNLSDYRGAGDEPDVLADLNREPFARAYERLRHVAAGQLERRREALGDFAARGQEPDLETASPCLFCIKCFSKTPWRPKAEAPARSLPVLARAGGARPHAASEAANWRP
ncbi:MAG TPA: radical SAM protein [Pyrinomonadaceae bacterium]|nr:radical SAM protein [Pyrinomonadaceae bacterium]